MSSEQNRRAAAWSMEIAQPSRHQRRAVCLFTHSGLIPFFRPRYCISKVYKSIFHARERSFWCMWVVWPAIIELIMMKTVWKYHTWFLCENNFSRISEALNLDACQRVLCMHESKRFNRILAKILAMASSCASGGKTSDRLAVGIECHWWQRVFSSGWRYDQHRRSAYLCGTACYIGPDSNKTNLYARRRPSMSTAALDRSVVLVLRTHGRAHRPKGCI